MKDDVTDSNANFADPAAAPDAQPADGRHNSHNSISDTERSAELLRLALPMISKHGRGFAPVSYAVWYEYVRGANKDLKDELDELVAKKSRITESLTFDIYQRYVVDRIEQAMREGRTGLLDLMNKVDESVRSASDSAADFDGKLEDFSESLSADTDPEVVRSQVTTLREDVRSVNSKMRGLQEHLEGTRSEVQRLAQELAQAREEAQLDPLSGLLNRRGFDIALAAQIEYVKSAAEPTDKLMTLMIIDIDHFKSVNDTHGHLFGDKVIQGVAKILDGAVMRKDYVCRFGGEEFAVILPATDETGGLAVAERVRNAVSQGRIRRANSTDVITNITVSAGVAQFEPGDAAADLIERADRALYRAKNSGRNKVCGRE